MELEFAGQHEKNTYFKAVHWMYRPAQRDFIIRIVFFAVFSALYTALVISLLRKEGVYTFEFIKVLRYLIIFLILAFFIFQPYFKSYQAAFRLWQDPMIRRKISGRVSPLGIQFDPSNEWTAWDQFVKIYKSADLVLLFPTANLFIVLPRKFFKDDKDWQAFQTLIASKAKEVIE